MFIYQQERDYTCGVAVVRTLLAHYGCVVPSERRLMTELWAHPKRGVAPARIATYMQSRGFKATVHENGKLRDLRRALDRGERPILLWSDWGGHYVVVMDHYKDVPTDWALGLSILGNPDWPEDLFILGDPAGKYDGTPSGIRCVSGAKIKSMWFDTIGKKTRGLYITVKRAHLEAINAEHPEVTK